MAKALLTVKAKVSRNRRLSRRSGAASACPRPLAPALRGRSAVKIRRGTRNFSWPSLSASNSLNILRKRSGVNDHHSSSSMWSVTEALQPRGGASAVSNPRTSVECVRCADGARSSPLGCVAAGGCASWEDMLFMCLRRCPLPLPWRATNAVTGYSRVEATCAMIWQAGSYCNWFKGSNICCNLKKQHMKTRASEKFQRAAS